MTAHTILLDTIEDNEAAALLVDGKLEDLLISVPKTFGVVPGSICRAIIERFIKGQGGAILKLHNGYSGFLRNSKGLTPGQTILVQVISYPEDEKATPVTDRIIFKGRSVIITPGAKGINISRQILSEEERVRLLEAISGTEIANSGFGLIVRSEAKNVSNQDIHEESNNLLSLAQKVLSDEGNRAELLVEGLGSHELATRDWPSSDESQIINGGFEAYGVLDDLDDLMDSYVKIGTGSAFIEPTRALIAIDLNTGSDLSPAAGLKVNLNFAKALPRQLRLRGLGGQITIDLAPMPKKDRKQFENTLKLAFKSDPIETALVGWTPLGHFEIQRKRERVPLSHALRK